MSEDSYNIRIDNPAYNDAKIFLAAKCGDPEYDREIGYIDLSDNRVKIYGMFPAKYLSKLSIAVRCYIESIK